MEYLPTFTQKIAQSCRSIVHTWSIWESKLKSSTNFPQMFVGLRTFPRCRAGVITNLPQLVIIMLLDHAPLGSVLVHLHSNPDTRIPGYTPKRIQKDTRIPPSIHLLLPFPLPTVPSTMASGHHPRWRAKKTVVFWTDFFPEV